jgi:two-component system OmpR family sensor kinase
VRLRLTLWFVLGIVVVAVAGSAGFYAVLSEQLRGDLDSRLTQQLNRYQQVVATAANQQELADLTKTFLSGQQSNSLRQNGYILSLQTRDGTVVSNSSEVKLEDLRVSKDLVSTGKPFFVDTRVATGSLRVAGTSVMLSGEQVGAVEIAGSLGNIADTMRRLLMLLAIGGFVGCVAVGLGSWLLLGRALDPVRRITKTAAAISREDLSRRIEYSGRNDEIGELAFTMDAMLDRLESAFAAQDRFISDASHELRTPLTIIKGHLQVLDRQESPDPEFVKQEHALVLDELNRMNRLVADLLTLARATRNDFLRSDQIDLDAFLESLLSQGSHLGDRRWTVDSLPGGTVVADQDRLTQVFLNLMQNAVRFTKPGQVVALGGKRVGGVSLWVRDEGEGMTDEMVGHAFDRFCKGGERADHDEGLGLGLAIVKAIVEAHGGSVSVESRLGAGTRFVVLLPVLGSAGIRAFSSDS